MPHALKQALAHTLWIGGPSDAGKTTVTDILKNRRRWQWYPCDLHEHNHLIARADPTLHPTNFAALGLTLDEAWLQPAPEQLFAHVLASNEERFPLICEDLSHMPKRPPVLVEGPRLFPKFVVPVLTSLEQAIWLLPTEAFRRASLERRDKPVMRHRSRDPERLRANFLERERRLADYVRRTVVEQNLPYIEVDGRRSAEEIANDVEAHFERYLATLGRRPPRSAS